MTTATKITLFRVFLIPIFLGCMYMAERWEFMLYVSLGIFAIASLTDILDGKIARLYHQVTDLGKFLDPLADKVLVIAAMAMFCQWDIFPAWVLVLVLTREFAVTGLRLIAVQNGRVIAAGWSGKVKTAVTMAGLCIMLMLSGSFFTELLGQAVVTVINWIVVGLISVTTLYSGVDYFAKNWDVLKQK